MFRFGFGIGFGTGARKVFGALLKAKGTVVASLAKLYHEVAATVTGSAIVPDAPLKVISRVAATVTGEGVVEAELPSMAPPFAGNYTWWANMNDAVASGGYVDEVPLTGIADRLVQPNAVNRLEYLPNRLDGNVLLEATSDGHKMYKEINTSVFNGGGTIAFLMNFKGGITRLLEFNAGYNYQLYSSGIYFPLNTPQAVYYSSIASNSNSYDVIHLSYDISTNTMKGYLNGVLIDTVTVTQDFTVLQPFTIFNYKNFNAEQGYGEIGDIVVLSGDFLNDTQVANDYNNFWKPKYPSLP